MATKTTTPPKKSNAGVLILGAAALGVGAYFLLKKKPEEPPVTTGTVTFTATPTGGEVFIGDVDAGHVAVDTPLVLTMEAGTYTWKVVMDGNPESFKTGQFVLVAKEAKTIAVDFGQTEELHFEIEQPSVAPTDVYAGTQVTITVPVTSTSNVSTIIKGVVEVHYGSILPGTGDLIKSMPVAQFQIAPMATYNMVVNMTEVAAGDGRRDVVVRLQKLTGEELASHEFDDAYMVKEEPVEFNVEQPVVNVPASGNVTIQVPVTMTQGPDSYPVAIEVHIAEASAWLPTPGDELGVLTQNTTLTPGSRKVVSFNWTATGNSGNKDITVKILHSGAEVYNNNFDDAFSLPTLAFAFNQPTVNPNPGQIGQSQQITCPIVCNTGLTTAIDVDIVVQEASILPTPGSEVFRDTVQITISPGQTKNAVVSWLVGGNVGKKDITVEIKSGSTVLDSHHFDDAFNVAGVNQSYTIEQPEANPDPSTLGQQIQIIVPIGYSGGGTTDVFDIKIEVAESSWLPTPGTLLATLTQNSVTFTRDQIKNVTVNWVTAGAVGTKDITVRMLKNGVEVKASNFDDAFRVNTAQGTLQVNFSPSNAVVKVGSYTIPSSGPYLFDPGSYNWTASASGYASKSGTVTIVAGQTASLNITLVQQKGYIYVAYTPSNAVVNIGSSRVYNGQTYEYAPGSYAWTASADGYGSKSGNITVTNGQTASLNITLNEQPISINFPQPEIYPDPGQIGSTEHIRIFVGYYGGEASELFQVVVKIQEASWLPTPGTTLATLSQSAYFGRGGVGYLDFQWIASGAKGNKDITVEVWQGSTKLDENHFDDAFSVNQEASASLSCYLDDINMILHYEFWGFQPNAVVTLRINGSWTAQADGDGHRSGAVYISESAGTLIAQDSYGNYATAYFEAGYF